jgi:hypothetical protein
MTTDETWYLCSFRPPSRLETVFTAHLGIRKPLREYQIGALLTTFPASGSGRNTVTSIA